MIAWPEASWILSRLRRWLKVEKAVLASVDEAYNVILGLAFAERSRVAY